MTMVIIGHDEHYIRAEGLASWFWGTLCVFPSAKKDENAGEEWRLSRPHSSLVP